MARKPENTFRQSVHKHLSSAVYHMKLHNIYLAGPADDWYSGRTTDLWVEWKYLVPPKRSTTAINISISALQGEWLRSRYEEGRNVVVIAGCPEGGVVFRDLSWETPLQCGAYRAQLWSRKALAQWIEGFVCRGFDASQSGLQQPAMRIAS